MVMADKVRMSVPYGSPYLIARQSACRTTEIADQSTATKSHRKTTPNYARVLKVFNQSASEPKKDRCGDCADDQGKLRAKKGAKTVPLWRSRFRFHRPRHGTSIRSATMSCNPTASLPDNLTSDHCIPEPPTSDL